MRSNPWYLPALTLLALGCSPPVADYVVADVPRGVDTGRVNRDAARTDGATSADGASDAGLGVDVVLSDLVAADIADAPAGNDIPVFDVVREDRPRACIDTDLDGIYADAASAPDRGTHWQPISYPAVLHCAHAAQCSNRTWARCKHCHLCCHVRAKVFLRARDSLFSWGQGNSTQVGHRHHGPRSNRCSPRS